MQPQYYDVCQQLPDSAHRVIEKNFQLTKNGSLFSRLEKISHADVTLQLLYAGERKAVELLIGHPITICPPCLTRRFETIKTQRLPTDDQVITYIGPNTHVVLHSSSNNPDPAAHRFARLRIGMTITQALNRAITKRDLQTWAQKKLIDIERR